MGGFIFKLPDVGEGLAEAEIAAWHVAVGDQVQEDQPLADVMTDKATVELTSPVAGVVARRHGEVGEKRPIGSPLVEFEAAGAPPSPKPAAPPPAERPLASPAVRQKARDRGIDLHSVKGSGPAGRITHADLDAPKKPTPQPAPREAITEVKIIGLRRVIAERMQDAKRRIPHFAYVEELDVTALEELRAHLNADKTKSRPKLTLLPFLMRALVWALPGWPQINARFDDEHGIVRQYASVHIGIATQTESGLTVPVVRHAETRDLWECAAEVTRLAEAARAGRAAREDLSGSTITITSLGPLGGIVTTPVINAPEVAIIGVNRIVERPVVKGGLIVVRKMMNLSSSFDHRVVDGWDAAEFIQKIRALLEQPATLFMHD